MKVQRSNLVGIPVYYCRTAQDWIEVSDWMRKNNVEESLVSSGAFGYYFQVQSKHDWFVLKWL